MLRKGAENLNIHDRDIHKNPVIFLENKNLSILLDKEASHLDAWNKGKYLGT